MWDMRMGRWNKLKSHTRNVLCMHYYEDNRLVSLLLLAPFSIPKAFGDDSVLARSKVSGSLDRTIRVWDLTRGGEEEIGTFEGHKDGISSFS